MIDSFVHQYRVILKDSLPDWFLWTPVSCHIERFITWLIPLYTSIVSYWTIHYLIDSFVHQYRVILKDSLPDWFLCTPVSCHTERFITWLIPLYTSIVSYWKIHYLIDSFVHQYRVILKYSLPDWFLCTPVSCHTKIFITWLIPLYISIVSYWKIHYLIDSFVHQYRVILKDSLPDWFLCTPVSCHTKRFITWLIPLYTSIVSYWKIHYLIDSFVHQYRVILKDSLPDWFLCTPVSCHTERFITWLIPLYTSIVSYWKIHHLIDSFVHQHRVILKDSLPDWFLCTPVSCRTERFVTWLIPLYTSIVSYWNIHYLIDSFVHQYRVLLKDSLPDWFLCTPVSCRTERIITWLIPLYTSIVLYWKIHYLIDSFVHQYRVVLKDSLPDWFLCTPVSCHTERFITWLIPLYTSIVSYWKIHYLIDSFVHQYRVILKDSLPDWFLCTPVSCRTERFITWLIPLHTSIVSYWKIHHLIDSFVTVHQYRVILKALWNLIHISHDAPGDISILVIVPQRCSHELT